MLVSAGGRKNESGKARDTFMLGKEEQRLLTPGGQLSHTTETSQTVNQQNKGRTLSNLPTSKTKVNTHHK